MADELERETEISGENSVDGDHLSLGDARDSAVAIGRGAKAEIHRYGDYVVNIDSLEKLENEPSKPGEAPYKGLTYFTEEDADIFFVYRACTYGAGFQVSRGQRDIALCVESVNFRYRQL